MKKNRDLIKILKLKLIELGISQSAVCQEAGKPQSHLSKLLSGDKSPNMQTLMQFIDAADRLRPGFADQYWLAVAGRPSIPTLVESMNSSEIAVLLRVLSDRIADATIHPASQKAA
jgi:hypothetical protein